MENKTTGKHASCTKSTCEGLESCCEACGSDRELRNSPVVRDNSADRGIRVRVSRGETRCWLRVQETRLWFRQTLGRCVGLGETRRWLWVQETRAAMVLPPPPPAAAQDLFHPCWK